MIETKKHLIILGIRGIPAAHGGFETFAEYLSLYLLERDWKVTVYCQSEGKRQAEYSTWNGVDLVTIPVKGDGALASVIFDLKSIVHSLKYEKSLFLTLGYNTAVFNVIHRLFGKRNIINMDGIEWKRDKWNKFAKFWFWLNERFASRFSNHMIADHPEIKAHLAKRATEGKITMLPYGALPVTESNVDLLTEYGLKPREYSIVIARPEPENSIFEIVAGFSEKKRHKKLVILGRYDESNSYHQKVKGVASDEVIFLGAIYDVQIVSALRFFANSYVHGHQVGGTNPSLVEALGCGVAILAHDNKFNRWVAGNAAIYFSGVKEISEGFERLFGDNVLNTKLRHNSRAIFERDFTWDKVLADYTRFLAAWHPN